jgi:hypothetical protein
MEIFEVGDVPFDRFLDVEGLRPTSLAYESFESRVQNCT